MIKFVAVAVLLAVAAASPDPALISAAPLAYSTGLTHGINSFYNSPLVYSSSALAYPDNFGFAHLIKKRSVPLISSYLSSPLTYGAPLSTSAISYATPYGAALTSPLYNTAHFIKKRSASLILPSASYISPATYTSAPLVSAYSSPIYSPYYSPYDYAPLIKK